MPHQNEQINKRERIRRLSSEPLYVRILNSNVFKSSKKKQEPRILYSVKWISEKVTAQAVINSQAAKSHKIYDSSKFKNDILKISWFPLETAKYQLFMLKLMNQE